MRADSDNLSARTVGIDLVGAGEAPVRIRIDGTEGRARSIRSPKTRHFARAAAPGAADDVSGVIHGAGTALRRVTGQAEDHVSGLAIASVGPGDRFGG